MRAAGGGMAFLHEPKSEKAPDLGRAGAFGRRILTAISPRVCRTVTTQPARLEYHVGRDLSTRLAERAGGK